MKSFDAMDREAEREAQAIRNSNYNRSPHVQRFTNKRQGTTHIRRENDHMADVWEYLVNEDVKRTLAIANL